METLHMTITSDDPRWPKEPHPGTDEVLTRGSVVCETEVIEVHTLPPTKPITSIFDVTDDDELVYVRERTHDEMVAATDEYNRQMKAWQYGGVKMPGRTRITGTFETESGATCSGVYDGDNTGGRWTWIRWRLR